MITHLPGVLVEISLDALPAYLEQNGLEAMSLGEIRECENRTGQIHKFDGPVWVKRCDETSNQTE